VDPAFPTQTINIRSGNVISILAALPLNFLIQMLSKYLTVNCAEVEINGCTYTTKKEDTVKNIISIARI